MQGTRWADPKEESFIDQVNKVYHFYDEAKENSKKMKKEIVLNFNAAAINKKYDKVLKEVF